jgi:hypothetical protein
VYWNPSQELHLAVATAGRSWSWWSSELGIILNLANIFNFDKQNKWSSTLDDCIERKIGVNFFQFNQLSRRYRN